MIDQPFSTIVLRQTENEGTIVIEPLRFGFGHTMGVALRRVLLGALGGSAVTKVRIKGVTHQFTTLKGLSEDIVELILNIKQLRVSYSGDKPETLKLQAVGPSTVTGKDLVTPATVSIANPNLVLSTLADKKSKLVLELTVESGVGYVTAEEQGKQKLGVIPIDASFSPVKTVFYTVESTRVGRRTDYDKLVLTLKTDGTIHSLDAVKQAALILSEHFSQIVSPVHVPSQLSGQSAMSDEGSLNKLTVDELDLPTRVANALRKGGYRTIGDIVSAQRGEIEKVKNIGEKSVSDLFERIRKKGVQVLA